MYRNSLYIEMSKNKSKHIDKKRKTFIKQRWKGEGIEQ